MQQTVLIRFGAELAIKARRTRQNFLGRLGRNMRDALSLTNEEFELRTGWNRFVATIRSDAQLHALTRVFGVSSISVIDAVVPADLDAIVARGRELYAERVRGRRYAVRARRHGRHGFASRDIEVELGRALNEGATVDLRHPDVTVHVEVREDEAFLFAERLDGPGGLPLGVEGSAISLISGGYDSAVSAWLMLKRGVSLDYVFCNLGGDAYERAVVQVAKVLADDWSWGSRPRLHVVDFGPALDELRSKATQRYWQVVLKRLMYRVASAIAAERDAQAIVTGEALGQVSSQTLTNLRAIEPAAAFPVFRPLIGFDKEEIIARARHVGTAALSEQVKEYCAIAPGHPVTAAPVDSVEREEAKLDLTVLERAVADRKVLDLRALTAVDLVQPYLFIDDVPADAIVLDCRPEPHYRAWHWPGATHWDEWELLNRFEKLDRDPKYVLYCAHGIQSAYLAERMQRSGYEAYSFRGGAGALRKLGETSGAAAR
ncbi:MAG TPA: tRNA uracil 4-sulfurtransferase ThiI [Longimicrobiales bacterium]|nr:tRNA uracil 4-sulfurtransferase ThiI [Longimicrobiales bacterium]